MPPSNQDFFIELKDWSERKLQLLDKYLSASSKILGSIDKVYYVDGFAGAGIYSSDGSKGSPIRAAEIAQKYHQEKRLYSLVCVNVEDDKDNFANLEASTSSFGSLVKNYHGTFVDNVDQILQLIGTHPAIFFLDPFGVKDITWDAISKVIQRGHPTDIWIRFDYYTVRRLDGSFGKSEISEQKKYSRLCDIFGNPDRTHLHSILSGVTPSQRINNAVSLYEERLVNEYKKVRGQGFSGSYKIKALAGRDKYFLVFATAHPLGARIASTTVNSIEETYQRELEEYKEKIRKQPYLFSINPSQEELSNVKVEKLWKDIWDLCRGEKLSRSEIHMRLLPTWFGKIGESHLTQAFRKLISQGKLPPMKKVSGDNVIFEFRT